MLMNKVDSRLLQREINPIVEVIISPEENQQRPDQVDDESSSTASEFVDATQMVHVDFD
ncbi:hypothetical protein A2U01_0104246, partial [Trifolium medium]|nr:hypothetical protein [Trifolium medium]